MDNTNEKWNNSRRSFLKVTSVGTAVLAGTNVFTLAAKDLFGQEVPEAALPWYRTISRWGQINITEIDPGQYDIPWWRSYWKQTETQESS